MTRQAAGAAGTVVRAADIQADELSQGTSVKTLIRTGGGEPGLDRRLADLAPGARLSGDAGPGGQMWFVIAGSGQLELTGRASVRLEPDRAVLVPPDSAYQALAGLGAGLRLDIVSLPAASTGGHRGASQDPVAPLSRDFGECEIETTGDRQFRVLFGPGKGCSVATQFVGEIPPGRAPDHSHPYDEVVLILRGEGIAHIGGVAHAVAAGTCAHLPPGLVHCLENTGQAAMRVLGVFHPADSPAAKLGQSG
jgi:quercetin dioxygenase-like cupin family protein